MYYRGVAVAIVVYDVSDGDSFDNITNWFRDIREKQTRNLAAGNQKDPVFYYLIGNKCDLQDDERAVTFEEAQQWVEEFKEDEEDFIDIKFIEVSAKDGINIAELFNEISSRLLERHISQGGTTKSKYTPNDSMNTSYLVPQKEEVRIDDNGRIHEKEEVVQRNTL